MEKKVEARKIFLGSAVFAVTFYLAAKFLNYFVFADLLRSVIFGFLMAGEIGFFIADKNDWYLAHKKTFNLLSRPFVRGLSIGLCKWHILVC
jgi:hypothetical protein